MHLLRLRRPLVAISFFGSLLALLSPYIFVGSTPLARSAEDPVLVGAGDIAACDSTGDDATANLLDTLNGTVFTVGDNVYPDGSAENFRDCYEPTWGRHKARTRPALGNHEYYKGAGRAHFDYFQETTGRRGEGYYSYNLGAWHVVVLNSNIAMDLSSPQAQWLRADLASNGTQCTVAYWHHALFSSGSHGNYPQVRDLWHILYEFGVDVVLNGHDHNYERFAKQDPDGRPDDRGIRQFIVGTGGGYREQPKATVQPNSEIVADTIGLFKLTLHANSYDWEFLPVPGETFQDAGQAECVDSARPTKPPILSRLSPAAATVGGPDFTLTATGAYFVDGTTLQWNGGNLPTTFINSTQLTASIPSELITANSSAKLTVQSPSQGDTPSNALNFLITPPDTANLLANGDFEADDDTNGRPDGWDDSEYATQGSQVIHSGRFALQHYATNDATYVVDQTVKNLEAGNEYEFTGWINIPSSNDVFGYEFDLEVRWQDNDKQEISTSTLQKSTEPTNGWHQVTATLSAPAGATNAKVRMEVDSLNTIMYVDDLAFRPAQLPSTPGVTPAPAVEPPSPAPDNAGGAPSTAAGGPAAADGTAAADGIPAAGEPAGAGESATFPPSADSLDASLPASETATSSPSKGELMLELVLVLTIGLQIFGLMFIARMVRRTLQSSV